MLYTILREKAVINTKQIQNYSDMRKNKLYKNSFVRIRQWLSSHLAVTLAISSSTTPRGETLHKVVVS